jgi:hypothetical protein
MSEEPTNERKSDFRLNASSVANNSENILDEAGDIKFKNKYHVDLIFFKNFL